MEKAFKNSQGKWESDTWVLSAGSHFKMKYYDEVLEGRMEYDDNYGGYYFVTNEGNKLPLYKDFIYIEK